MKTTITVTRAIRGTAVVGDIVFFTRHCGNGLLAGVLLGADWGDTRIADAEEASIEKIRLCLLNLNSRTRGADAPFECVKHDQGLELVGVLHGKNLTAKAGREHKFHALNA